MDVFDLLVACGGAAIPVTVLTGYLGSGKTTLLRRLLHQHAHTPLRLAVIENEFATSGIGTENELREDAQHAACRAQIIETSSGCLCCSAGGKDFKRVLAQLVDHRDKFDHVIIETTGLADPAFAATFFKPKLRAHYRLDAIVTLVDAQNVRQQLRAGAEGKSAQESRDIGIEVINEAEEQIALADRILLNKADLVSAKELDEIEKLLKELNPSAPIARTEYAKVDAASILGIGAFDVDKTLARDEGFLDFRPYRQHDSRIQSVTLRSEGEYAMVDLQRWVGLLLRERGAAILRTKGVVHAQGGRRFVLQGVHSTFAFEPNDHVYVQARNTKNATADADVSSAAAPKTNRFVFIGRDLHPRDLLAHYQRHLKQNEAGDVSSGGDERVPSVRVEAWTGATAGGGQGASVGGRWVSSLVVFGILYAFSRYRHAVTDALGLPSEWAWLLVVVAVLLAAVTRRLF